MFETIIMLLLQSYAKESIKLISVGFSLLFLETSIKYSLKDKEL